MTVAELRKIAVLSELEEAVLTQLVGVLEERQLAGGEQLFAEGALGDGMYFIVEGVICVEKVADAAKGTTKTLSILSAGDYLGEMSLVERKPRSASALATTGARVWRLSGAAFERLLAENSAAAVKVLFGMIRTVSDRLRRASAGLVAYDEIGKAIGESKRLQELLDVVLRQLCQALQAAWGMLVLKPQFAEQLEVRSSEGLTLSPGQRGEVGEGKGVIGLVRSSSVGLLARNLPAEDPFRAQPRLGFETSAMLLVPIRVGEEFLGEVLLGHPNAGWFDVNHLNLVEGVARQAAQAILNARHREEEESRERLGRRFVRF